MQRKIATLFFDIRGYFEIPVFEILSCSCTIALMFQSHTTQITDMIVRTDHEDA